MVTYNFKTLPTVPSAKDLIDIILSKTQRKTPTVIRKGYKISRIRAFYMRKVKFTQQNFHEKLSLVIDQFPKIEELHPFYADLINILYSKDHYKLALGQLNTARHLISNMANDYVHMLKYGDSLYRCKQLKRAALGRMCTLTKKLNASLGYLELVRQHLARLPSIDPTTRTLLVTGYPNVGKSSFINKVSRANVEVQPYAFTTKSVFVGHFDYKYLKWQVIDTPGILDHPLEDRNTIEMQAITALAHLHACVLFFIDISEQCGYSIKQQVSLFHSIKPLFANKPLVAVATKSDLRKYDQLSDEEKKLVNSILSDRNLKLHDMSNISEDGISNVKNTACDELLQFRVEKKLKGKKVNDVMNRIHVATPVPRDDKLRGSSIPETVVTSRTMEAETDDPTQRRKSEKQIEYENGGPGIYQFDYRTHHMLENDDWKFDIIPEIMDGKNIADFIDPDIDARLDALEDEEQRLMEMEMEQAMADTPFEDLTDDQKELVRQIREKRVLIKNDNDLKKNQNTAPMPRKSRVKKVTDVEAHLAELGLDGEKLRGRSKKRKHTALGLKLSPSRDESKGRSASRSVGATSRTRSQTPGFRDVKQQKIAQKLSKVVQRKPNLQARMGEGDRVYLTERPKHLFTGKRTIGKNDRR